MILLNIPVTELDNVISAKEAAKLLGITSKRLRVLAGQDRVELAFFNKDKGWFFLKSKLSIRPGARGPAFGISKKVK
jgi:hypothetical protein